MPDAHSEEQDVWTTLLDAGFLHALKDAHEETTLTVYGALSRAAGFKERSFGYTAYDVLESQLDHAFGLGPSAPPQTGSDDPLAGKVVRDNLNGSPGWRYGSYRIILKRHEFGAVESIRWDQLSHTKQAVSRQGFGEDPQLALELELPAPVLRHARPGHPGAGAQRQRITAGDGAVLRSSAVQRRRRLTLVVVPAAHP